MSDLFDLFDVSVSPLVLAAVVIVVLLVLMLAKKLILRLFGVVLVPEDSVALVNKKFVLVGSHRTLPDGAIIALNGEAGWQADALPPGFYSGYWPWQYKIALQKFITIPEGKVGVVESKDGRAITGGRVLGKSVQCDSFQGARAFLQNGGERGPQLAIILPGTYRINTALFEVRLDKAIDIPDNMVGVVTTREGRPLPTGEIAGNEVPGHQSFQDGQAFVNTGGTKGLQEQVILAGRYYINPLFASVELKDMTIVPIAHVGVVIAYVGAQGVDVTGDTFKHGNLVTKGQKGVWVEPLDPGKYPINPYTHRVENVPTANVVLNWATGKTEAHNLDKNLSTITVRSSDGFPFNLDVSQIIHIPRTDAPKVIARFGSIANLVTQVLEPTIGNYFRNAAQGSDVITFLRARQQRQKEAKECIAEALEIYNVGAVDTLIGDIAPPEALMKTLTDRKIAEQQKVTFQVEQEAEEQRKALEQARATADTQKNVVKAERDVEIESFNAQAAVKRAEGEATSVKIKAEGDANATQINGSAQAAATLAIGQAEAQVIEQKIKSMDSGNYAAIQIAQALAKSQVPLVPEVMAGGGTDGTGGTLMSLMLANMIRDMNGQKKEAR